MRILNSIPAAALTAALALLGTATPLTAPIAHADDTDLYLDPNNAVDAGLPKVLFNLDYRANLGSTQCANASLASCSAAVYFKTFSVVTYPYITTHLAAIGTAKLTNFDVLKLSLYVVFIEFENFEGAFSVSHNHVNSCAGPTREVNGCSNGAYILQGFTEMNAAGRTSFLTKLINMKDPGGALAHTFQLKEVLFEAYRYIKGWDVYNGRNGYTDWNSGASGNQNRNVGDAADTTNNNNLLGWDSTIMNKPGTKWVYKDPIASGDDCTKLFMIHFMFGVTSQEDDSDAAIKLTANSTSQGMGLSTLSNGTNGAIQMVSYMKNNDLNTTVDGVQSVTQYFVTDASSTSIGQLAAAGGTSQVAIQMNNPAVVIEALRNILREILSVSTTFVAASVPVNVFNRSESLDNVFIALFQVDSDAKPTWIGNVKKLKFGDKTLSDGTVEKELQDANFNSAIGNDGRINFDALTYWTIPGDLPTADTAAGEVDSKDGRVVDRGAAGQKIPGFRPAGTPTSPGATNAAGSRQVFYDPTTFTNGTATALVPFIDTAAATLQTTLGAATTTDAANYIKYARGMDAKDEDSDTNVTEPRAWIVGDPLHSRPLPINYGFNDGHNDETNPLIYVAIGSNDGSMRLIRNSLASGADTQDGAGEEAWAFFPQATMSTIKTLYTNSAASDHPYSVDGAPASLTIDIDGDGTVDSADGDKVYLYFGLRRGGRTFYALDITDPTTPKILWRINNSLADYTALGYSFAQPRIGNVNLDLDGDTKKSDPVVFLTGGYNLNKDTRDAVGTDDTYGNAFYVVNAKTGELVWKSVKAASTGVVSSSQFGHQYMTDSIPGDPAVIDSDGDGLVDRVVVGDTGGQVWRFDVASTLGNWRATRLANFGRHHSSTTVNDLRFGHRSDVVPSRDKFGKFDAVVIGSGDRENPLDRSGDSLDADTPINWMFMIKDRKTTPYVAADSQPTAFIPTELADVTDDACVSDSTCGGTLDTGSDSATNDFFKGWKLELEVGPGEKSLSAPLTIVNTVFFTTYLPFGSTESISDSAIEAATCGPSEGKGAFYAINLADATLSTNFNIARDGQDASTNTGRYTELASAGIPADVVGVSLDGQAYVLPPDLKLGKVESSTRWRTFWYEVDNGDD